VRIGAEIDPLPIFARRSMIQFVVNLALSQPRLGHHDGQ
jgi:hypothetical protein